MKRAKKCFGFLAGILLLLFGSAFRDEVLASSLTSLPSLSAAGIGEIVGPESTIDGRYDFTPLIGSETKIRFGSTDGSSWDNLFCQNGEKYSKCCSEWWPAADVKEWSNLRSFTPLASKKGKMYAEYTNVGECHGENVTMRIWLEDWQNTIVPAGYEDVDAVIIAVDHDKPVIDIKGLLWIKVRFAYYDSKGNPLDVKGYFTLSDLDFKQGFYLADETEHIYLTKEADARIVYDERTKAIWSARRGSEPDGGTTPDNPEGWVTYTFEGSSQTMVFYNGGTISKITGPGEGVTTPRKWPDDFVNNTSSTYNNWHGSSRETGTTVVPWNTSEFGYTANVPCHLSRVGDLVVKKMDAETKEALSGAEFTVYRWANNTWSEFKKLNWVEKTGSYLLEGIRDTDSENGKFRVAETKNPSGYTGNWEKEFSIEKEGMQTIRLEAENTRKTGSLKIKKTEENSGKALEGAEYQVIACGAITTPNGTVLLPDQTVAAVLKTDKNGEASKDGLEYGTYLVRETAAPKGYVLDTAEKKITIGEQNAQITLAFTNGKNRFVLQKVSKGDGTALQGAVFRIWTKDGSFDEIKTTDKDGKIELAGLSDGIWYYQEEAAPEGYLTDGTRREFTVENGTIDGKTELSVTVENEEKDLAREDLTITKKIKADEITWAHGNPTFLFSVTGTDLDGKAHTYQCYVTFTKDEVNQKTGQDGYTEQSVQIRGIPAGKDYQVQEKKVLRYSLVQVTGTENVTVKKLEEPSPGKDPARVFSVSVNLCDHPEKSEVVFENQKYRWDDYGHNSIVKNRIPVE